MRDVVAEEFGAKENQVSDDCFRPAALKITLFFQNVHALMARVRFTYPRIISE